MTTKQNDKAILSTLMDWEASGNLEPGAARDAKAAVRALYRASTTNQRNKALGKLWAALRRNRPGKRKQ